MNEVRDTIVHKIKENIKNVKVITNLSDLKKDDDIPQSNTINVLFKRYIEKDTKKLEIIDYNSYKNYLMKLHPNLNIDNLDTLYVLFNGAYVKVDKYNDGILTLDEGIENLYPYNDVLVLCNNKDEVESDNEDFIYVYSTYSFSNVLDFKYVEYLIRYNIDIFLYKDLDNSKFMWYNNILSKLFHRSFSLLGKKSKTVGNTIDIQTPLSFRIAEDNKENKIIRATMLLKLIEKE